MEEILYSHILFDILTFGPNAFDILTFCTKLDPVEMDDNSDMLHPSNTASSTAPSSTKANKKVKPVAQSFAAIQALWQHRLPNAGCMIHKRSFCVFIIFLILLFAVKPKRNVLHMTPGYLTNSILFYLF